MEEDICHIQLIKDQYPEYRQNTCKLVRQSRQSNRKKGKRINRHFTKEYEKCST